MVKTNRYSALIGLCALLTCVPAIAQSGDATYKSKCQSCHGANGVPNPSLAKMLGIKPVSDPYIQKLTPEQMFSAVKNGKGKMKPVSGLTDVQIKDVVAYYHGLK